MALVQEAATHIYLFITPSENKQKSPQKKSNTLQKCSHLGHPVQVHPAKRVRILKDYKKYVIP